jgi:hypothetical protein
MQKSSLSVQSPPQEEKAPPETCGVWVGAADGCAVGFMVGTLDGAIGLAVGSPVSCGLGFMVGTLDRAIGLAVGSPVGCGLGFMVGAPDGAIGLCVGAADGCSVISSTWGETQQLLALRQANALGVSKTPVP